jgi:hypothetical protein
MIDTRFNFLYIAEVIKFARTFGDKEWDIETA